MPVDKVLSRPGAPVFGLGPEAWPGLVQSTPFVAQSPDAPTRSPFLKKYPNPLDTDAVNRGFYPLLYRPGGLLYGR